MTKRKLSQPLVVWGETSVGIRYAREVYCGACHSILLGFDEKICPSCGRKNNMGKPKTISQEEAKKLVQLTVED